VANGIIIDPSGPGTPSAFLSSIGGNNWGAASGCFIATATPGSQIKSLFLLIVSLLALMGVFLSFFINRK